MINKSRYDSIDSYLSCSAYSDIDLVYDEAIYQKLLNEGRFVINKSRYDSLDSYLSCSAYSDIDLVYDEVIYQKLLNEGMFVVFCIQQHRSCLR